jgi:protocatechuate 3,4-dioxygenase beta subunit
MKTNRALKLARLLPPAAALFALACALLAPTEAGRARAGGGAQIRESVREGPQEERAAGAAVRGRVIYDDTERPARRARLMFVAVAGARNEYTALTDARGEFRIPRVRAGRYLAFVDVPGVLSPVGFVSLGEMRGGGPDMPDLGEGRAFFDFFEVDGKEDVSVTVRARRGATLSGRVTYSDGDPAVNATVNLMRRDSSGRLEKFLPGINMVSMSGLRTDDRGVYRLTGLPPGEYVVGVSEPVSHAPDARRYRDDDTSGMLETLTGQQLLLTFHPSSASVKEAAVVKVAAGDERADVDVRIPERELRAVAGVVLSRRERRPVAGARVTIVRRDDPGGAAQTSVLNEYDPSALNGTTTDEEGRWRFTEIPDGPYTVNVKPPAEYEPGYATTNTNAGVTVENMNGVMHRRPRRKRGFAPARRDVEVASDLSDVTVEVGDGARVAGTVVTEDGDPVEFARINLLRVPEGTAGIPTLADALNAEVDGARFSVEGLPAGRYFVQSGSYHDDTTLYVKSVIWNGKDLMREPLELAEGASAEGVRVVYARGTAALRVKAVRAGERSPALHTFVVLVPADSPEWSPYAPRQLTCWTADEGSCVVKGPPGDYRVVALARKGAREGFEAEVKRRAAAAPLVSLRAGESKELEAVVPDR